ncbi:hypothetical protein [Kluyvera georgiana]|uniref:hypothetical protein n=1 Tax=Kluyvera georgiana TaxID=73098 RepID=UPI00321F66E3
MTATNQQMTREQLADLSTLAAQLLCKAEANDDRDTAVMAYAVQRACSELEESRREFTAANATIHNLELKVAQVVAENAGLKNFISTDCFVAHVEPETFYEEEVTRYVNADGYEPETPATDAAIANIRAQGVEMLADKTEREANGYGMDSHDWRRMMKVRADAIDFAAQLRQGAEHE